MKPTCPPDNQGCTRRTILQGLGVLALGSTLPISAAGCSSGPADAGPVAAGKATLCNGNQLCLDLRDSANAPLVGVGGAVVVPSGGDMVMVIRTASNTAIALSAVCTHQGCTVGFSPGEQLLVCPCHGSQYSETGQVLQGPASRALRNYMATVSNSQVLISLA